MTKNEIISAIKSGLEVVSSCNAVKMLLVGDSLYFGFIGTNSAIMVRSDAELNLYDLKISSFSEHLAR